MADRSACWQLWFDGTALPNPGKIGVGVLLLSPDGVRSATSGLTGGSGCNNEAELQALIFGLEFARGAGARCLVVRGDSDFVVRHVSGAGTTAVPRLLPLIANAQVALAYFDEIRLIWIPRHRNGEADSLARQALGLPDKPATVPGKSGRRR